MSRPLFRGRFAIAVILAGALEWSIPALPACDADKPTRTPGARYVLKGGEAYDKKTDLTWQRCSIGQRWKEGTGCVGVIKQLDWDESMKQAADVLKVSIRTVAFHKYQIMREMEFKTNADLIQFAIRKSIVAI